MSTKTPAGRIPDAIPDTAPDTDPGPRDRFVLDTKSPAIGRLIRSGIPVARLSEIANADAEAAVEADI